MALRTSPAPPPGDSRTVYAYLGFSGTAINDANCASASTWNGNNRRGFMWASGEIRCATYNHYLHAQTPRTSTASNNDPIRPVTRLRGFRAARSRHAGGVNLLLGDGSVRFVERQRRPPTWRRLGTRAGGEVVGDF